MIVIATFIGALFGAVLGYFIAVMCFVASERRGEQDGSDKETRK